MNGAAQEPRYVESSEEVDGNGEAALDMNTYLQEMEHAVASIIPLIWAEHQAVEEAETTLRKHEAETKRGYQQAQAFDDLDDDEGLATAIYWETYFGPDKKRYHAEGALARAEAAVAAHAFSRSALSSSLLQYAKQGISAVHGDLAAAPTARQIHGLELKVVIWQGRNQASHWEEGKPHPPVVACFETLKAADTAFTDYRTRNLAFEIVRLLGWNDWATFDQDMRSLG